MIPPGETIGILGGGQLGRMLAIAAAQLGYRCHVYAPEADSIAAEVAPAFTNAAWNDAGALARFAAEYYQRPMGEVALPGLPKNLRVPKTVALDRALKKLAKLERRTQEAIHTLIRS